MKLSWLTPERGLSSVGRAPALQAGCHRFESVRLHHYPTRSESAFWFFLVLSGRIARTVAQLTSFREIIGVIGRIRVGMRWSSRPTMTLSKSSTLTKCQVPAWEPGRKSFPQWKGRETYMLLIGSDPRDKQKGAGSNDRFLRERGSFFFRIKSSAIRAFGGCLGSKRR